MCQIHMQNIPIQNRINSDTQLNLLPSYTCISSPSFIQTVLGCGVPSTVHSTKKKSLTSGLEVTSTTVIRGKARKRYIGHEELLTMIMFKSQTVLATYNRNESFVCLVVGHPLHCNCTNLRPSWRRF